MRRRSHFIRRVLGLFCSLTLVAAVATAQTPRPGTIRVLVEDATDLPILRATVIAVSSTGGETRAQTNESGTVTLEGLASGLYELRVDSPGFDRAVVQNVAVRSGARTNREVKLQIAGFVDQVDVAPADVDRALADAFATDLTDDEIQSLPDDPDELAQVLAQLAGVDAEIRVDGFVNDALPPGTQIQSVRIVYDAASAGSASGGPRIEIRTQPGGDRWRSNANMRIRDEALNARNAYAPERPHGQTRLYSWSVNGPIVKNRTGFSFSVDRSDSIDQQAIRAATASGFFADLIRQPNSRVSVTSRLEHELTPAQRLRVDYEQSSGTASNQGLGELDLPERAYTRDSGDGEVRISHNATINRDVVNDARFRVRWRDSEAMPESTATALRVAGAFSSGGAQQQGGRSAREYQVEDELLFSMGSRHQATAGFNIDGGRYFGDEWRNAGGTFSFSNLDDFIAGRPTTYTQRLGDPSFSYSIYQFGEFIQDNIRVRKNLMLNLGVRHEFQTHLGDWANFAPRLGINWTPSTKWRTTLRGAYSISFQPLQGSVYEQTFLVNGARQRDIVLLAPSSTDPFAASLEAGQAPPGIIRAETNLQMPEIHRVSFGLDQPIGKTFRARVNVTHESGDHQFRSVDVNAPIEGVRPDPAARTITELRSSARTLNEQLELNLSANYPRHRISGNATYRLGENRNETDGPLTLPQDSFNLDGEWGPSRQDIRHRFDASMNGDLWYGFRLNGNVRLQSASPYTITTGVDTNGDGVNNERDLGVGRNSARGSGSRNLDMTLTWGFGVGQRPVAAPPRGRVATAIGSGPPRPTPKVRFEFFAQANNALNLVNQQGYSGVLTSPFYGLPTSAAQPRRITVGFRAFY